MNEQSKNQTYHFWSDRTKSDMRGRNFLISAIILFVGIFTVLTFWKYDHLLYNGLDLAIFTNVFWNTAQGDFFVSSIQGGSYLGDHFEPLILLFAPFFRLWPDPRFLLLLQILILALAAWPLWYIAKFQVSCLRQGFSRQANFKFQILFPLLWLFSPFVHNAALFEFHMLSFAPFFLFWMYYFYLKRHFWPFLLFTILALLVREDIAFLVIGFSLFTFIEWWKKPTGPRAVIFWSLAPLILSLSYFTLALTAISLFEPQGSYKFLLYYEWMKNADALTIFLHLFRPTNLAMVVGLLIPFLFTPLLRPRFLLLALFPFLQFALTEGGGGSVVLQTHYTLLFLPALFLGIGEALSLLQTQGQSSRKPCRTPSGHGVPTAVGTSEGETRAAISSLGKLTACFRGDCPESLQRWRDITLVLILVASIYSTLTLGPLLPTISKIFTTPQNSETKREFLQKIPRDASVATTYAFLSPLSARRSISSLHYAYLGKKQYASEDYTLPDDTEYLLIDFDDLLSYELQFPNIRSSAPQADTGDDRLRTLLNNSGFSMIATEDAFALFQKGASSPLPPLVAHTTSLLPQKKIPENILSLESIQKEGDDLLITFLKGQKEHSLRDTLQLRLVMEGADGQRITRSLPIGWGISPPHEWKRGERVTMRYHPPFPIHSVNASIVRVTGGIEVDGLRSVIRRLDSEKILPPTSPDTLRPDLDGTPL